MIIFDLDDTLLHFSSVQKQAFKSAIPELTNDEDFLQFKEINSRLWSGLVGCKNSSVTIGVRRFELWLEASDRTHLNAQECADGFLEAIHDLSQPTDGAMEVLTALQNRPRNLALITNGFSYIQKKRIRSWNLDQVFQKIVVSEDLGVSKPDPLIFETVIDKRVALEEHWMIGDSIHSDVAAAKNAGMKSIWYNPHQVKNESELQPTMEIHHLSELLDILP